ncbi:DUF624 domain-containing protein [uncultured Microbacterium sp.]|nr:DUF624 domain-containing protein [uncultured Microbacterium sp.]
MTTSRRAQSAAVRADRSGSGPTLAERPPARFPGASAAFALFGEVLQVGLLITLVSLPVVTLPAALAAGIRHLRRFVAAEASPISAFWADVRRALVPGSLVGLVATVLALVLLLDIDLARSGLLPGGAVVEVVGWIGLAVVSVVVLAAAGAWTPERGWRAALRAVPGHLRADIAGAGYLVAAAGFVVILTWMLPPLVIGGLGCAALAVISVPTRRRRR